MNRPIKIIDLFAGPGGLGEGFSSLSDTKGAPLFKIAVSIEKEASAHKTLTLRAFYRQFPKTQAPTEYYDFLTGKLGKDPEDILYKVPHLRKQSRLAHEEARRLTLGEDNQEINRSIEEALGKRPGPWVLIGGPPCQAYSLAGRSRNKGIADYCAEDDHRNFLYREYLKVIAKFRPTVFVMENVKGMLSAKVSGKSIANEILNDLKQPAKALASGDTNSEYEVFSLSKENLVSPTPSDFLIRAEEYGIPQARHRVILLGVRKDIAARTQSDSQILENDILTSIYDVISDLPKLRSGLSKSTDSMENWVSAIRTGSNKVLKEIQKLNLEKTAELMSKSLDSISNKQLNRGHNWWDINKYNHIKKNSDWYIDPVKDNLICNHETRGHIPSDLQRYLFCACYAASSDRLPHHTPKAKDFPKTLAPKHANWETGKFADRFRVQIKKKYATTITSHISKDGHYFIHYDPKQCRSLTVREAARVQTFPDNYFFVGNRTQQYVQVGNAVPPLLAKQIAEIVWKLVRH